MTVKFYLQYKATGKWTDWVGADQRDSSIKMRHTVYNKQLKLGTHPATISKLSEDTKAPTRSRIWTVGCFFQNGIHASSINYETGTYISATRSMDSTKRLYTFLEGHIDASEHPHWLAPIESEDALTTIEVMDTPSSQGFLMLAKMSPHDNGWRQIVMGSGWQ